MRTQTTKKSILQKNYKKYSANKAYWLIGFARLPPLEHAPQGDSGEAYYVGLVRRDLTCLRVKCPAWVTSQQQGEAYGMEVGLRDLLKVRPGKRMVLGGDNIGQIWNAHKSRAPPTSRSLARIMSQV
jgi:hypothetical protein